jgi:hypothetical protein
MGPCPAPSGGGALLVGLLLAGALALLLYVPI